MRSLRYHVPPPRPLVPQEVTTTLCIFGASPAGITAAIQARQLGHAVELCIPSSWLGGLTSGGLSNTDIGNKGAIGGLAREFYRRVGAHYGIAEEWRFEPHVAEQVFTTWLAEYGVVPRFDQHLAGAEVRAGRIAAAHFESGLCVRAELFIDASYEGDLLAAAGVSFATGRESNGTYGEILNGVQVRETHQFDLPIDPWRVPGQPASGLLPGILDEPLGAPGSGDQVIQAYNFRVTATRAPGRLPWPQPEGYDPLDYELLARVLARGWNQVFRKFDRLRGGKVDINNHGPVSTDWIGGSHGFPLASPAEREAIFQGHVRWQQGWFWFLAHDPRVPEGIRAEMNAWGLPADEFTDTGGWPRQLYIREARRMLADVVITEHDCRGRHRASDPIGLGAYGMDSHHGRRLLVDGRVLNEGDVQTSGGRPYPISYRAIVPRRGEATNLLVPVCLSASHIAFGSIRMEPVFMLLGQSAALAAHLALRAGVPVQQVRYEELRPLLEQAGQVVDEDCATNTAYEPEAAPPLESRAPDSTLASVAGKLG